MGRRRKTEQDYMTLANEREIHWLGTLPRRVVDKTTWRCSKGHTWQASYHSIRKGTSCPYCSNRVPKTEADYVKLAEENELKWVGSQIPPTTHEITKWQCAKGHSWDARYHDIHGGNKCPSCSGRARKTENDYHRLAENLGFQWLGPKLVNTHTKTQWKCSKGHVVKTTYTSLQRRTKGNGCKYCSRRAKYLPDDYQAVAQKRGFQWVGKSVSNSKAKTLWKCMHGHTWRASLKSIRRGHGCPHCAGLAPKTPHHYHVLAYERGLEWVGPEVPNVITKTKWRCSHDHVFESPYNRVQQGDGCIKCAGLERKGPADYRSLASSRGFSWVGDDVPNVATKTEWSCLQDHRWFATYDNIRSGTGCPECQNIVNGARVSEKQKELCQILGGSLNYKVGSYLIDVALVDGSHRIAVEYDCWYWHGSKLEEDEKRDRQLIAAGWKVLRIRTNNMLPPVGQLLAAIGELRQGKTWHEIVMPDWGDGPMFARGVTGKANHPG
jgi:hypothetical protein